MIISVKCSTEKEKRKLKNVKGGDGTWFSIPWPKQKRKLSMTSHCLNVEELPLNLSFSHHSQTGISALARWDAFHHICKGLLFSVGGSAYEEHVCKITALTLLQTHQYAALYCLAEFVEESCIYHGLL